MKKALVIAFVLVFGVTLLASAQIGTFTGDWKTTLDLNIYNLYSASGGGIGCIYDWQDIFSFTSTLEVDYNIGGWVFSSDSGFDARHGFNSQEFSAVGMLGAFLLSATMEFLPSAVLTSTQQFNAAFPPFAGPPPFGWWLLYNYWSGSNCRTSVLTDPLGPGCTYLAFPAETTGPVFKDFELSAGVNIAGVSMEGLFLFNAWAGTDTTKQLFVWDVCRDGWDFKTDYPNAYWDYVVNVSLEDWGFTPEEIERLVALDPPLDSIGIYSRFYQTGSWTTFGSDPVGAGLRLKLAGAVGSMNLTSFTYFNMKESDKSKDKATGCPVLGKKGDYAVADDTCGLGFTEEYFMVEGIPFCCDTTLSAALKIVCEEETEACTCEDNDFKDIVGGPDEWREDLREWLGIVGVQTSPSIIFFPLAGTCTTTTTVGFDYLQLLVEGIPFIPGFFDLTASIKLTTDEKEFALCGVPSIAGLPACFDMTIIANWDKDKDHNNIPNKFTGIDIKDLSLTCDLTPGVTATFKTVLYDLPKNALKTITSDEMLRFLVPADMIDIITDTISCDGAECGEVCRIPWIEEDNDDDEHCDLLVEYWDVAKFKYYAWESVSIVLEGDACCGGAFDISIDNYIGKVYEAEPQFDGCYGLTGEFELEVREVEVEPGVFQKQFRNVPIFCCEWNRSANYQEVGQLNQLFSWMATDVDASISLFSNFTLYLGAEVSFRGWEKFSVAFGYIW